MAYYQSTLFQVAPAESQTSGLPVDAPPLAELPPPPPPLQLPSATAAQSTARRCLHSIGSLRFLRRRDHNGNGARKHPPFGGCLTAARSGGFRSARLRARV